MAFSRKNGCAQQRDKIESMSHFVYLKSEIDADTVKEMGRPSEAAVNRLYITQSPRGAVSAHLSSDAL